MGSVPLCVHDEQSSNHLCRDVLRKQVNDEDTGGDGNETARQVKVSSERKKESVSCGSDRRGRARTRRWKLLYRSLAFISALTTLIPGLRTPIVPRISPIPASSSGEALICRFAPDSR
jgi:hypothetical protein